MVEAVSQTRFYTSFRVKYEVAAVQSDKWKNPQSWPTRMTASLWKGNPHTPLKKLAERVYTKKIYVGNLSPDLTDGQITTNMKKIYEPEMKAGTIKEIETIPNRQGATRSVCVVLTSHIGKTLMEVDLKTDHYPRRMTKWVRWWKGYVPYPENHQRNKPAVDLNWS